MGDGIRHDVGDVLIHKGVGDLPATALRPDHRGTAQHPKVLGDQWLWHVKGLHQLMHVAFAVLGKFGNDGHTYSCGQCPKKFARALIWVGIAHIYKLSLM